MKKIRFSRLVITCLVILCFSCNFLVSQSEATGLLPAITAVVSVPAAPVIGAVLIGLGVLGGVAAATDWEDLVQDAAEWLEEKGEIDAQGNCKIIQFPGSSGSGGDGDDDPEAPPSWAISTALIDLIRSWLFDTGVVSETTTVSTSGFSSDFIGEREDGGPKLALFNLVSRYPHELTMVFRDLGVMDKVAVFNICRSSPYELLGWYFGPDGKLMGAKFENPLGKAHSSLYGVYSMSDLTMVDSTARTIRTGSWGIYTGGVFYNKALAEASPNFLTSNSLAFNWSYDFSPGKYSTNDTARFVCSSKNSTDSTWSSSAIYSAYTGNWNVDWPSYYITADSITWNTVSSTDYSTDQDLELGYIGSPSLALDSAYGTWAQGARIVSGQLIGSAEDTVTCYPITMGNTLEATQQMTQEQIWTGTASSSPSVPGGSTTVNPDPWEPPSDPESFALDLSKVFPFCIPFDIYAFVSCLNADPVTPVINWEIPVPGGSSYPLTVDLSPFDSVAKLLRRLELLAFIVGLAIKTRDLIRG